MSKENEIQYFGEITVLLHSAADKGGQQGQLPRAPSVSRVVSLYFRLKSACSFALRFMLLTQIIH